MSYCSMPLFFKSKDDVRSKKDRLCCECRTRIPAGEPHYSCSGIWDGEFSSFRQHPDCKAACVAIREFQEGECIPFGSLFLDGDWQSHAERSQRHIPEVKEFRSIMSRVLWRVNRRRWVLKKEKAAMPPASSTQQDGAQA